MKRNRSPYPDISNILAQKSVGRTMRARLSFAQKLDLLDALRERVEPIVQARASRLRRKTRPSSVRA
jgi:hypothetical protein